MPNSNLRLILASASPRRAELLRAAGYRFETIVATVDESIRAGESPPVYVRRVAADKSAAALATLQGGATSNQVAQPFRPADVVVLGADTTVVVDGDILSKPRDEEEAAAMVRRLSGKRHEVLTGVSLRHGAYEVGRVETTAVYVRALSEEELIWYAASGEGQDKAGAYAVQGLASRFIPRIDGSYSNVVGLPVACVAELLRSLLASRL
jgi:septum formation protein